MKRAPAATFSVHRAGLPDRCPVSIPWKMIEPHEAQARVNHGQSLARLHQRGGLSPRELYAVLLDRPFDQSISHEEAIDFLLAGVFLYGRLSAIEADRARETQALWERHSQELLKLTQKHAARRMSLEVKHHDTLAGWAEERDEWMRRANEQNGWVNEIETKPGAGTSHQEDGRCLWPGEVGGE